MHWPGRKGTKKTQRWKFGNGKGRAVRIDRICPDKGPAWKCINVCLYTYTHTSVCVYICKRNHYEVIFPIQLVYETNSPVLILGIKSGDCRNPYVAAVYKWQVLQGQILNIHLYSFCNCVNLGPQQLNPRIFTPVWKWKLLVILFASAVLDLGYPNTSKYVYPHLSLLTNIIYKFFCTRYCFSIFLFLYVYANFVLLKH